MSTSEQKKEHFNLNIVNPKENIRMTLLDGLSNVLYKGYDNTSLNVPKGLYVLRSELDGQILEKTIKVDSSKNIVADAPLVFSSAPLATAQNTHEYYHHNARDWSIKFTSPIHLQNPESVTGNSSIFVFIRATGVSFSSGQDMRAGFAILDANRQMVCVFDDLTTKKDFATGWVAFSAPAKPGMYYLRYNGAFSREIPIYLYNNWQTQIFVTFQKRPLFGSTRIFMARQGIGFKWDERNLEIIDSATFALQNNKYNIPKWLENKLLHGKFENPMMGLAGAYFLLKNRNPQNGNRKKKDLIDLVLQNLNHILGFDNNSPDLKILRFLNGDITSNQLMSMPFTNSPMFLTGLKIIVEESTRIEGIIPKGGLIDLIAAKIYTDMAWSSWSPPEGKSSVMNIVENTVRKIIPHSSILDKIMDVDNLIENVRPGSSENINRFSSRFPLLDDSTFDVALNVLSVFVNYLEAVEDSDDSETTYPIVSYQYLAMQFNVPIVTVKRVVQQLLSYQDSRTPLINIISVILKQFPNTKKSAEELFNKVLPLLQQLV